MHSPPSQKRKLLWPALMFALTGAALGVALTALPAAAQAAEQSQPVLVELFTSEGCSDCPPADRLLEALDKTQPFAGEHAIVLSEHVTYWNQQGWRDPFSIEQMTERQKAYVDQFRLDSAYTPQMVVDGTAQFVGSDVRALDSAMRAAAKEPKATLEIQNVHWEKGTVEFAVRGTATPGVRLVAALAADAAHVEVTRGENAGHTLQHVAVVRVMKNFGGDAMDGRELKLAGGNSTDSPVRLVAFAVEAKTGHVVGAAEKTLTR